MRINLRLAFGVTLGRFQAECGDGRMAVTQPLHNASKSMRTFGPHDAARPTRVITLMNIHAVAIGSCSSLASV